MIVGLFFFRPIVKILIYRFKTSLLVTGPISRDPGDFQEISGNLPEIIGNMSVAVSHTDTRSMHAYRDVDCRLD
jgi:hypothetical protein